MARRLLARFFCVVLVGLAVSTRAQQANNASPVIRSAQSGSWSDATTWDGGKVPTEGNIVQIREGHIVQYTVESKHVLRSLHISGTLAFAHDRDTLLNVGLIRIAPGNEVVEEGFECNHIPREKKAANVDSPGQPGFSAICNCCDSNAALLVGTPQQPVQAKHRAHIRLHYIDGMDRSSCPAIVCCGGRMDFHGAPLSRTWVKLGTTAEQGADEVQLAESVRGWNVGDRIVVTASAGNYSGRGPQSEERQIVAIDGERLSLDRPLVNGHRGGDEFSAEVANLSRNVIVESADAEGARGHTMYHAHSAGSISYAEFRHLGKQGVLGRYPMHFHLCQSTMRGSSVVGASIWNSANRWIAVHGVERLIVRDCVGYKSIGHGFFLEDGTEVYNVFDRNLAVGAQAGEPLPKQALPFDKNDGAGFWWANSHNTFTRNVAVDCAGYGFRYEATPKAGFKDKEKDKAFGSPDAPLNLTFAVLAPDGSRRMTDIRRLPFVRFEGNSAHNIANYGLNMGEGTGGVGPNEQHPFVIRDMKVWNAQRGYTVHVPHVLVDGMRIHWCGYEIYRARYLAQDYRDVRLSGIRGKYAVSDLESYLSSGAAVGEPGVGLNRSRLPGFPKGTGAGGTSYQGSKDEVANLTPIDDLPPTTVITDVRREQGQLMVRGTTADDGPLKKVTVNDKEAKPDAYGQWQVTIERVSPGALTLTAFGEDMAGNIEKTSHEQTIVVR